MTVARRFLNVAMIVFLASALCSGIFVLVPALPGSWLAIRASVALMVGLCLVVALRRGGPIDNMSARSFLWLALILTLVPRLFWVLTAGTQPTDDFLAYHDFAVAASEGRWSSFGAMMPVVPFKFCYPALLSMLYRIAGPHILVAQLLNVAASAACVLLLYGIGRRVAGERGGRTASVLFALWPAQLQFTSCIAQEHIFAALILGVWFVLLRLKHDNVRRVDIRAAMLAGVLLGTAHFLRNAALLAAPALVGHVIVMSGERTAHPSRRLGRFLFLWTVSTAATLVLLMGPLSSRVGYPVWRSGAGINLLVGSNHASDGFWTAEGADLPAMLGFDYAAVQVESNRLAFSRWTDDGRASLTLMVRKFRRFWGSDDFGTSSAFSRASISGIALVAPTLASASSTDGITR